MKKRNPHKKQARKRLPLSEEQKKARRRKQESERRQKKKREKTRRKQAAKKGWATRRIKELEAALAQTRAELSRQQLVREYNDALDLVFGRKKPEEVWTSEEIKAVKQEIYDLFFKVETEEERYERMVRLWPEAMSLVAGNGLSRRGQILMWLQRNFLEPQEFWQEYRRRQTG